MFSRRRNSSSGFFLPERVPTMKYSEKLLDPRWQKKRLKIFEHDGWTCQRCHDKGTTLHVHHKRYLPGKDPWDYDERLLITLCKDCHESENESRPEYEEMIIDILKDCGFLTDDLYAITSGFACLNSRYPPEVTATIIEKSFRNQELWDAICERYFQALKKKEE